eukprot:5392478-Amphidinium_carterae.1
MSPGVLSNESVTWGRAYLASIESHTPKLQLPLETSIPARVPKITRFGPFNGDCSLYCSDHSGK